MKSQTHILKMKLQFQEKNWKPLSCACKVLLSIIVKNQMPLIPFPNPYHGLRLRNSGINRAAQQMQIVISIFFCICPIILQLIRYFPLLHPPIISFWWCLLFVYLISAKFTFFKLLRTNEKASENSCSYSCSVSGFSVDRVSSRVGPTHQFSGEIWFETNFQVRSNQFDIRQDWKLTTLNSFDLINSTMIRDPMVVNVNSLSQISDLRISKKM